MHREEHLRSSNTIQDIVLGMADGLRMPFALAIAAFVVARLVEGGF